MKTAISAIAAFIALFFILLVWAFHPDQEIMLESLESKTTDSKPVFNKIKFFWAKDRDVWMMNQSHHGPAAIGDQWERLAIVVNKTTSPKTVRFFQLEQGALEGQENLKERPFRVSCFMCHNNGPRSIRPQFDSSTAPVGLMNRMKLAVWNLRIQFYGRMIHDQAQDDQDVSRAIPFRNHGSYENETLNVATCTKCHNEDGVFSRGFLKRQQTPTIRFLVESGQMPPFGFSLTPKEKQQLDNFLMGF